jgi:hypothetical protein
VLAAILERDPRAGHKIPDGACDDHRWRRVRWTLRAFQFSASTAEHPHANTKMCRRDDAFPSAKAAPEADLRGGAQVCGGQTRVKPSNAPDATIVVATSHKLVTVEAISRRRDLWAVASRCGKEVRVRRVLVVLLILGATFSVSPALAAHGKKPSSPGHHSGIVVDQRAIAIIAK